MLYKDVKPGQKFIFKSHTYLIKPVPVYEKRAVGFISLGEPYHLHNDEALFNTDQEVYLLKCGL
jgi:hypothetical protein